LDPGTTDPGALVRSLYEAYGRRDWDACTPLLHADVVYELPRTDERVEGGPAVLDYQRAYPEPWGELSILRVIAEGDEAAAEISVRGGREATTAWRRSGSFATGGCGGESSTGRVSGSGTRRRPRPLHEDHHDERDHEPPLHRVAPGA
jgi:hypothetical protein